MQAAVAVQVVENDEFDARAVVLALRQAVATVLLVARLPTV
jgi:hypothetical protein